MFKGKGEVVHRSGNRKSFGGAICALVVSQNCLMSTVIWFSPIKCILAFLSGGKENICLPVKQMVQ